MVDERFVPPEWLGKPILRVEDLAPVLEMHVDDVYRLAKHGTIPSYKLGGRRLFRTQAIVEWLSGAPTDVDQAA